MKTIILFLFIPFLIFSCDDTNNVTANDEFFELKITNLPQDGGSVEVTDFFTGELISHLDSILKGTKVLLKATSSSGYRFSEWQTSDIQLGVDSLLSVTLNVNKNISAVFIADDEIPDDEIPDDDFFELKISSLPEVGGSVVVKDFSTGEVMSHLDSIPKGTKVLLKATSSSGYRFSKWQTNTKQLGVDSLLSVILNENKDISAVFRVEGPRPVEVYGSLSVEGKLIVDFNGAPVQLRGMSMFWSQWMGKYWNADVVSWLANDWEANIIRASMGVDDSDGYLHDASEKTKVETVVNAAIEAGIYVIIDWHSHHAENYEDEAVAFFSEMAQKYGEYPNVIYEIYNEPLNISWVNTLKPYAEKVIDAIREKDPDNLILVGTPKWSQDVDAVIDNTIEGENIAYVLHFYASEPSHHTNLFNKAQRAIDAGIPLFVSEWGVSEASGNGNFNKAWTKEWIQFMDDNNLSWCNWSMADKDETSAALLPGANTNGGWDQSELSPSGIYVRDLLRSHEGYSNPR